MTTPTRLALSPLVQAAILSNPRSKERAVKGSELLALGKVQRLADAPLGVDRWLVYGSSAQPYRVSVAGGTCDCPDRAQTCKHLHACQFALALGVPAPVEVMRIADCGLRNGEGEGEGEDADLWAAAPATENPDAILDAEISAKVEELTAAGVLESAEMLVIGDWVWIVGDPDADVMDRLGVKWHERRGCHYWRPVWAAVEAFNEHADLAGLADKYGIRRHIPRRSAGRTKSAVELAMLIIPKLNRDLDGELWA